ncbi:MAG: phosphoenolpyruvate--protein phosphotransferase [Ruminococcus sp.]|nr:phosphoenolpyruvate--protein phosphotransferase [Oscillospiraceae bacterium]MDY4413454.1 phosphoenolpyruvate--protein phosphotransferase [Ruminococcus sp.]
MKELHGKGVSGGIAIGRVKFHKSENMLVKRIHVENAERETERFRKAKEITLSELKNLYEKALKEVGEENAQIFEIHQMMLDDSDYIESIENIISSQNLNAEYAVSVTCDNFAEMFSSMDNEYMQGRSADIKDISARLIKNLMNKKESNDTAEKNSIIFAVDLAPSETVQMNKSEISGFCTAEGSANSHTAILARTMNIPAIIGIGSELSEGFDGMEAIADGFSGTVYINPDEKTKSEMLKKRDDELIKRKLLQNLKDKENITPDGQKINIYANIGSLNDLGSVLENDAGGIGLFRSEFLYLESSNFPDEETQFRCYKKVLECMAEKKVIIRTLDIGADKQIDYFKLKKEENPALGFRAVRICLANPDIFKVQLRALYRASVFGNLGIMFPMIISPEEVMQIKKIVSEVKNELKSSGIPFKSDVETGIMIETPASVMISDILAKEVDFFSIGTNDLVQYTLALDRQNPELEKFCDTHHKAILRMIKTTVENAHKNGIWAGICGELGGDLELTEFFLAVGTDELSVLPSMVLPLREKVRNTHIGNREDILKRFLE